MMILGVVCILAGLGVFALWNVDALGNWDIMGTRIVHWCRKTLGRYGITAFYVIGGIILFLRGYLARRAAETTKNS